jgi:hypothetical protein
MNILAQVGSNSESDGKRTDWQRLDGDIESLEKARLVRCDDSGRPVPVTQNNFSHVWFRIDLRQSPTMRPLILCSI